MTKNQTAITIPVYSLNHLEHIVGRLLQKIEEAVDEPIPDSKEENICRQGCHERLFGKKSLPESLTVLTKLIIMLTHARTVEPDESKDVLRDSGLSAADVALVETFVQKMRAQDSFITEK